MTLLHRIEALAARGLVRVLRVIGPVRSSNLCGAIARTIGPWLPVSKVAHHNLRRVMPALDAAARRRVVRGVWENLGRTAGEFPHLGTLSQSASGPGWEIEGIEHVEALAARGGPGILFTGHLGNWEVMPLAAVHNGVGFASVYRPADNKAIDALILELRHQSLGNNDKLFAKGAQGARQTVAHLRKGGFIGLLQDQKMNDGIRASFFGHPAMTASALAALALKFDLPVLPAHTQRIAPCRFRLICEAPLPHPDTGDHATDVALLTQAANDRLEAWVREYPHSWLWLHRRWTKEFYADMA